MLETVDLSLRLGSDAFKSEKAHLWQEINRLQREAWQAGMGIVVVLEGWDFSGKAQCMRFLTEPMDPRDLAVHVMYPPSREEKRYPFPHRYWTKLPARGRVGIFVRSWYYHVLDARVRGGRAALRSDVVFEEIRAFERSLADDGMIIIKFWLHIDRKEQKRRRREFREGKLTRYRIGPDDPRQHWRWKSYVQAFEDVMKETDKPPAHWHVISANDERYAQVCVARHVTERIRYALKLRALAETSAGATWSDLINQNIKLPADTQSGVLGDPAGDDPAGSISSDDPAVLAAGFGGAAEPTAGASAFASSSASPTESDASNAFDASDMSGASDASDASGISAVSALVPINGLEVVRTPGILAGLDMSPTVSALEYDKQLVRLQRELGRLQQECVRKQRAVVFGFEGWDAAGKGGIIKRLTRELDPRYLLVHPVAAPKGDDAEHHYLWRFWKRIPPNGTWAIFDRTWYGRVLVERIEGYAKDWEWRRAYREIHHFESTLCEHGMILVKFWLHITKEEQLRRFEERERIPYKSYKITEDDWRNRDRWPLYETAVEEMLRLTGTREIPWHAIPANDKHSARIQILQICCDAVNAGLKQRVTRLRRKL